MFPSKRRLLLLLIGLNFVIAWFVLLTLPRYSSVMNTRDETRYLDQDSSISQPIHALPAPLEQARQTANPVRDGKEVLTALLKTTPKQRKMGVSSNGSSPEGAGPTEPSVSANKVNSPVAWVRDKEYEPVKKVLSSLGFSEYKAGDEDLDFFWNYHLPFSEWKQILERMKPTAKINQLPLIAALTEKHNLIKIPSTAIPTGFEIPAEEETFLNFSKQHPETQWVQKSIRHRGIEVKSPDQIKLTHKTIVQEFIANALLIDGRRFDVGVYVVITSLSPLRLYVLDDVAVFRFCRKRYDPLILNDTATYVVKPGYLNPIQIPELAKIYQSQNGTYKQAFNTYFTNQGIGIENVWEQFYSIISTVVLYRQAEMMEVAEKSGCAIRQLFMLLRFDFILDENWNVYFMEANAGPTLSYGIGKALTQEMYDYVIYSTLKLVGVAAMVEKKDSDMPTDDDTEVFQDWCAGTECRSDRNEEVCVLCSSRLLEWRKAAITDAYREHINRGGFRRIFPPPMTQKQAINWTPSSDSFGLSSYSEANRMFYVWFIGMCRRDVTWCI